jgi:hypothetical protein
MERNTEKPSDFMLKQKWQPMSEVLCPAVLYEFQRSNKERYGKSMCMCMCAFYFYQSLFSFAPLQLLEPYQTVCFFYARKLVLAIITWICIFLHSMTFSIRNQMTRAPRRGDFFSKKTQKWELIWKACWPTVLLLEIAKASVFDAT